MSRLPKLPRLSNRHKAYIYFLIGIAIGLAVVFFFAKDRFVYLEDGNRGRNRTNISIQSEKDISNPKQKTKKYHFRPFNPNTVTYEELISFGLSEKQSSNIVNYRSKAKGFKDEKQFRRLYCMNDYLFNQIQPYLIFDTEKPAAVSEHQTVHFETEKAEHLFQTVERKQLILDLNLSDTLDLQQLNGIGKVRAGRIYRYGKKLGGYVSVDQLKEVYGMDEDLFENIKSHFIVTDVRIKKINVNSDDVKYLISHPYIDFQLAKALIRYRKEYKKDFEKAEDIQNIHLLSEEEYERLLPYIKTED